METGKIKLVICALSFLVFTILKTSAQFITATTDLSGTKNIAMPVDLKLRATIEKDIGEIKWNSYRRKVLRYELEKSNDGENFNYVTSVAGNGPRYSGYSVQDRNPDESMNYYRLKIVTAKGDPQYSKMISLNIKGKAGEIKVLPTQIDQKLFIWVPANTSISNASITDASGRNALDNTIVHNATNLADVEISRLPVGLYNIKLLTNKGETVKLKFSKGS